MISVGDTLRRERIKRNLQIDQISHELKISPRFLEAIEDERFEKLPGGVFAKAFVRQYSRLLGLNEDELTTQLDQVLEPPPEVSVENPHDPKPAVQPIQMPRMEEWQTVGDKRVHWSGPFSAAIVVVLVMLVCSGVYAWMQRQHKPVTAQNTPPARAASQAATSQPQQSGPQQPQQAPITNAQPAQPSTTQPEPVGVAASPAPVQQPTQTQPAAVEPAKTVPAQPPAVNAENASTQPNANAPVHLEITASEAVWVLVRTDGKFAFTGTMDPNTKRTVDATKDVVLRLGNAGGVTITLNGQPVPTLGPKGQPRTIQFTSGGFQIVPAKPPSDSPAPIARL
jgi:cytoskeleton protein RodZ